MRRHAAPVLACLLVLAGVAAVPVAGHGNHLTADAQVVDDHVVVERSFLLADGYAVVHIDDDGQMGRAVGHVQVRKGVGQSYEIPVDEAFLSRIDGAATVWVTLHRDDGDGTFEPNQDTPLSGVQGRPPGERLPIQASADGNVNVVAAEFGEQPIDDASVTVRRVETNASGFVAVENGDGEVVGTTAVDAGVTSNASVALAESFFASMPSNESTALTAAVYRDDGDGTFDASTDDPVTVAGTPVATTFSVETVENASRTTSVVVTAEETTTDASTAEPSTSSPTTGADSQADGPSPGFGLVAAVLALVGVVAALRRRH